MPHYKSAWLLYCPGLSLLSSTRGSRPKFRAPVMTTTPTNHHNLFINVNILLDLNNFKLYGTTRHCASSIGKWSSISPASNPLFRQRCTFCELKKGNDCSVPFTHILEVPIHAAHYSSILHSSEREMAFFKAHQKGRSISSVALLL